MLIRSLHRRLTKSFLTRGNALLAAGLLHLALNVPAPAQTGPRLFLQPFPKEQAIEARAEAVLLDSGHVQETDEDFRLSVYETQGRVRVQPGSLISPRIGWDLTFLDMDGDSDALPDQLVDQSVGVAIPVYKLGDWIFGVSLGVGYAGEAPFGDGDAWYGRGSLMAIRQFSDTNALVLILDYDGNRTFLPDVPLPGIVYTQRVNKTFSFVVGVPVSSVRLTPAEGLQIDITYALVDTLDALVGYKFAEHWTVFGSLEHRFKAFQLDGLPRNDDRVLFEQRRAEIGLRYQPREKLRFVVAGGYAWGTEFSTGFDSRDTDELADVSDEPYVRAGLEIKF